jgi:hypothetical protein
MTVFAPNYNYLISEFSGRMRRLGPKFAAWQACFIAALSETKDPRRSLFLADQALPNIASQVRLSGMTTDGLLALADEYRRVHGNTECVEDFAAFLGERREGFSDEQLAAAMQEACRFVDIDSIIDLSSLSQRVEAAAWKTDTDPSPGRRDSGRFRKGRVSIHGIPVAIETPRGEYREGIDKDGKPWKSRVAHHYGFICKSEAKDGDEVDCFVGPHPESQLVFIIDQVYPDTGKYNEAKCMIGFLSEEEAKRGYLASYAHGWQGLGAITPMTLPQFKDWLENGNTSKPVNLSGVWGPEQEKLHPRVATPKGEYKPGEFAPKNEGQSNKQPEQAASTPHKSLSESPVIGRMKLEAGKSGRNTTEIVDLGDGTKGVWKPASGEVHTVTVKDRKIVPDGTEGGEVIPVRANIKGDYWKREIAASKIADILGMSDIQPSTVAREVDGQHGSIQQLVPHALTAGNFSESAAADGPKDNARAAVFDFLTLNTDRHLSNWMLRSSEGGMKLALIDNGLSFPDSHDTPEGGRSMLLQHAMAKNLPIPEEVQHWDKLKPSIAKTIQDSGLSEQEQALTMKRFDHLVQSAKDGKSMSEMWHTSGIKNFIHMPADPSLLVDRTEPQVKEPEESKETSTKPAVK